PLGQGEASGFAHSRPHGGADQRGLAADVRASDLLSGDVRGPGAIPGDLLPGGELGGDGQDHWTRQAVQQLCAEPVDQRGSGTSANQAISRAAGAIGMKRARRRIDVNLEELDRVLDGAREAPLNEADYDKLKDALHAMAALLARSPNTEKTSAVVGDAAGAETGEGADQLREIAAGEWNLVQLPSHQRVGHRRRR